MVWVSPQIESVVDYAKAQVERDRERSILK
jgi:hypothetical protein